MGLAFGLAQVKKLIAACLANPCCTAVHVQKIWP
jgi:hypothetical protein